MAATFDMVVDTQRVQPPVVGWGMAPRGDGYKDRKLIPRALIIILSAGVVLRIGLWLWFGGHAVELHNDERDYNILAVNLLKYGEYTFTPGAPTSLRPPLYPVVLAGIYKVFGLENWQAVRAIQSILSLFLVWIVYRLGATAFSEPVGLLAAAGVCFYPSLLIYNELLLTEVLFTFLLCWSVLAMVWALKADSLPGWGLVGVMLGLSALTRSVVWLFPPVLGTYLLFIGPGKLTRRLAAAALMGGAFVATIAPWSVRNTQLQKTFVAVDVMGGRNLMMGNYLFTPLYRAWDAISMQGGQSWDFVLRAEQPEAAGATQGQIDKLAMKSGLRFMLEHPLLTLQRCLIKFVNFWQLERDVIGDAKHGDFGPLSSATLLALALAITGAYAAAILSGIFGAMCYPPSSWQIHGLFLLLIAFVCGIHTIVFAHSRYHVPLMPIVMLYSATAILNAGDIWRRRFTWPAIFASTLCIVLISSWAWQFLWIDPQRFSIAL